MPNISSVVNERRHRRHTVLKDGMIVPLTTEDTINVIIRDLSVCGACIQLSPEIELPEEFSLLVSEENLLYPAIAKWRIREVTGVEFAGEPFRGSVLRYISKPCP